jgi:ribose-phosphate pyrophosphokinase
MAKKTEVVPIEKRDLSRLMLFAGNAHRDLAVRVADYLGVRLNSLTSTKFSDGEIRIRVDESARGNDVFLIQPTCAPANDTLMELLIMLDAFKRASARRMTVVMPYYGYARQDKKTKPREPITARLVADMIQTAGASRVVTIDLHAEQIQGFFNCPVDHLYGGPIIGRHLLEEGYGEMDTVVVSPDVGGVARAKNLAEMLGKSFAVIAKRRPEPNKVEVVEIIGDFKGKICVLIDDMIDTGGSIISGAEALMARGAKEVVICCTHAVFSGPAARGLEDSVISKIFVLDTIPISPSKQISKLKILSSASLIGEAIRRIHLDESVSVLFQNWR